MYRTCVARWFGRFNVYWCSCAVDDDHYHYNDYNDYNGCSYYDDDYNDNGCSNYDDDINNCGSSYNSSIWTKYNCRYFNNSAVYCRSGRVNHNVNCFARYHHPYAGSASNHYVNIEHIINVQHHNNSCT